jgi:hypothetical protein
MRWWFFPSWSRAETFGLLWILGLTFQFGWPVWVNIVASFLWVAFCVIVEKWIRLRRQRDFEQFVARAREEAGGRWSPLQGTRQ